MSTEPSFMEFELREWERSKAEAEEAALAADNCGWVPAAKRCRLRVLECQQRIRELQESLAAWQAPDACARGVYVNR